MDAYINELLAEFKPRRPTRAPPPPPTELKWDETKAARDPQRPGKYPTEDGLEYVGVSAPTPLSQLERAERQNDLAINVYGWEGDVVPCRLSKVERARKTVNLFLVSDSKNPEKYHYTWIKDFNRLLNRESKNGQRLHFCERCLHGFTRQDLLEEHKPECRGTNQAAVAIRMPTPGKNNKIRFENYHKQLKAPFIIYADFESPVCKIEGPALNPEKSKTQQTSRHEACGYLFIVVRSDGETLPPQLCRGPDAAKNFLEALQEEERKIKTLLANPEPMHMTGKDWGSHKKATNGHVCSKPFEDDSVQDHCHITGKYRGAAHNECNLKLRLSQKTTTILVVFHNLRGYDSHLIMQNIAETKGKVTCIPNNAKKYISFIIGQLRFIDSTQFMLSSSDGLVKASDPRDMRITPDYEPNLQRRTLLLRKAVYPYECIDGWPRFDEEALPPKEAFYSKLSGESITDGEYAHGKRVWDAFGCASLGDYHDLYLRTDVLLLADIFENFQKLCLERYRLDPAHYYTSPGLSWDVLLKHTGVELELLTDIDMHLFIEKGLRGGISMASRHFAKANNPQGARLRYGEAPKLDPVLRR
ncbi:uncharacterized protein LOC124445250 [Xenia sp. Carnegie-2017]|uniref:uncharacterized protein LOC124445250 n=1 Tax=Xenia sp. Carnegie-2017 TaxID=2897299 RepID=UPI001F0397E8|nr:uncharacterized protein LOC124445250 [Xenia sp. Carnegie-2017]